LPPLNYISQGVGLQIERKKREYYMTGSLYEIPLDMFDNGSLPYYRHVVVVVVGVV